MRRLILFILFAILCTGFVSSLDVPQPFPGIVNMWKCRPKKYWMVPKYDPVNEKYGCSRFQPGVVEHVQQVLKNGKLMSFVSSFTAFMNSNRATFPEYTHIEVKGLKENVHIVMKSNDLTSLKVSFDSNNSTGNSTNPESSSMIIVPIGIGVFIICGFSCMSILTLVISVSCAVYRYRKRDRELQRVLRKYIDGVSKLRVKFEPSSFETYMMSPYWVQQYVKYARHKFGNKLIFALHAFLYKNTASPDARLDYAIEIFNKSISHRSLFHIHLPDIITRKISDSMINGRVPPDLFEEARQNVLGSLRNTFEGFRKSKMFVPEASQEYAMDTYSTS